MTALALGLLLAPAGAQVAAAAPGDIDLISRADGLAGARGDFWSRQATISGDGRFVAFASQATNLSPDDTDGEQDVYLRDVDSGRTVLVSRATGPDGAKSDGDASSP